MPLSVFVAGVAIAAGASTMHLGRKERAWRAILNWRRSWLSREILLFSLFAVLGMLSQAAGLFLPWIGTYVALSGVALLFAIDRVYAVTRTPGLEWHSARVLWTGIMVAGVVADDPRVWGGAIAVKGFAYAGRKLTQRRHERETRPVLSGVRCLGGLLLPATVLWFAGAGLRPFAWCFLALGEIVDRAEFYLDLEIPTPARQVQLDMSAAREARARLR
jgi:hypothetical protein